MMDLQSEPKTVRLGTALRSVNLAHHRISPTPHQLFPLHIGERCHPLSTQQLLLYLWALITKPLPS